MINGKTIARVDRGEPVFVDTNQRPLSHRRAQLIEFPYKERVYYTQSPRKHGSTKGADPQWDFLDSMVKV